MVATHVPCRQLPSLGQHFPEHLHRHTLYHSLRVDGFLSLPPSIYIDSYLVHGAQVPSQQALLLLVVLSQRGEQRLHQLLKSRDRMRVITI